VIESTGVFREFDIETSTKKVQPERAVGYKGRIQHFVDEHKGNDMSDVKVGNNGFDDENRQIVE
jgi:hypothetical protein